MKVIPLLLGFFLLAASAIPAWAAPICTCGCGREACTMERCRSACTTTPIPTPPPMPPPKPPIIPPQQGAGPPQSLQVQPTPPETALQPPTRPEALVETPQKPRVPPPTPPRDLIPREEQPFFVLTGPPQAPPAGPDPTPGQAQALSQSVQQEEIIPRQVVVLIDAKRDPQRVPQRLIEELERRLGVKRVRVEPLSVLEAHLGVFLTAGPVHETAARAEQVEGVLLAQPNYRYHTAAEAAAPPPEMQYGLKRIRADAAQRHASGKGVTVAVLDTGVDASHPALKGQVEASVDFTAPDVPGGAGEIHGTAVAALIAAKATGSMKGVAPGARLLAVKCCRQMTPQAPAAVCTSETIARGLDYAMTHAARVINLSLGGPEDRLIRLLVEKALGWGIHLVAAAGNRSERPAYPAALDGVLAVTATDLRDDRYAEAAIGPHLALAAPGVEVLSALAGKRYHFFTGTSMATAHVSGALALLLEERPALRPQEARALLEATAVDLGQPGRDFLFGHGRLDACRALERVVGKPLCL